MSSKMMIKMKSKSDDNGSDMMKTMRGMEDGDEDQGQHQNLTRDEKKKEDSNDDRLSNHSASTAAAAASTATTTATGSATATTTATGTAATTPTGPTGNLKVKQAKANDDIKSLLDQVSRMRLVGEKVVSTVFELANRVASAEVHVNVSKVLWNVGERQDQRAQIIQNIRNLTLNTMKNNSKNKFWSFLSSLIFGGDTGEHSNTIVIPKKISDLNAGVIAGQENDIDILKNFVRKLHLMSLKHASLMNQVRVSLIRLVSSLDSTFATLNNTKTKVSMLEKDLLRVNQRQRLKNILHNSKVDYETGMIIDAKNGSMNVSIDEVIAIPSLKDEVKLTDPALLYVDVGLIHSILILIGAAAVGGTLAIRSGLPTTLGYIVGGLIAGPSGFNVLTNVPTIQTLAQIGSMFVFFEHGMRFRTAFASRRIPRVENLTALCAIKMILSACMVVIISRVAQIVDNSMEGIIIGLAVGSSSLSMAMTTSQQMGLVPFAESKRIQQQQKQHHLHRQGGPLHVFKSTPSQVLAAMAIALAIGSDGIISILLSLPDKLKRKPEDVQDFGSGADNGGRGVVFAALSSTLGFVVLVSAAILVEKCELLSAVLSRQQGTTQKKKKKKKQKHKNDDDNIATTNIGGGGSGEDDPMNQAEDQVDIRVLAAVAITLSCAIITKVALGLSFEIGAFFSGVLIAKFEIINIGAVRTVFGGLLFSSMGTILNPRFLANNLLVALLFASVIYIIKVVSAMATFRLYLSTQGNGRRVSVLPAAKCLTGVGELSLVFLAQAQSANLVSRRNYLLFIMVVAMSGLIFPSVNNRILPSINKASDSLDGDVGNDAKIV